MYAIVKTGGKQYRVEQGQTITVDRLGPIGNSVELKPLMLVDDGVVLASPDQLQGVSVTAKIISEHRGPKINGFVYKSKSNNRKRWGHRQTQAVIEITSINKDQ